MGLYTDLQTQGYLQKTYGVVSNYQHTADEFNCDNYHLFTAEAMLLSGFTVWPGYPKFFDDSEIPNHTGLICRYPGNFGNISVDELVGAATLDRDAAIEIYEYGDNHNWVFQPQGGKFVWGSWMARFINLIPYVKHQAFRLKWYDLFWKLSWSVACILSTESSGTSGQLLMWVQIQKMEGHYWICDQAIRFWKWRMDSLYVGGLQQVMYIYFGSSHPLTRHATPTNF